MGLVRYKPDVCQCVLLERATLVFTADDEVATVQKEFARVEKKCAAHADVPDEELYDVIYGAEDSEVRRKNALLRWVLEQDDLTEDVEVEPTQQVIMFADGDAPTQTVRRLKPGQRFQWRFEGTGKHRLLVLSGLRPGLTVKSQPDGRVVSLKPAARLSEREYPHKGKVLFEEE